MASKHHSNHRLEADQKRPPNQHQTNHLLPSPVLIRRHLTVTPQYQILRNHLRPHSLPHHINSFQPYSCSSGPQTSVSAQSRAFRLAESLLRNADAPSPKRLARGSCQNPGEVTLRFSPHSIFILPLKPSNTVVRCAVQSNPQSFIFCCLVAIAGRLLFHWPDVAVPSTRAVITT